MTDLAGKIAGLRRSQAALETAVADVDDAALRESSSLPGWTRGHLLTHLARNADSHARMLTGAARGELVEQYEGGDEQRDAEIAAGAGRPAVEVVADLTASHERFAAAVDAMPADAWLHPVAFTGATGIRPAEHVPFGRWLEVELHRADLGLGYGPAQWPADFVETYLLHELNELPDRLAPATGVEVSSPGHERHDGAHGSGAMTRVGGPPHALLAWLVDRAPLAGDELVAEPALPDLAPWET